MGCLLPIRRKITSKDRRIRSEPLECEVQADQSSHNASGIVQRLCSVPPGWSTPNMTATPEAISNCPPISPSHVIRRGTSPDVYIR